MPQANNSRRNASLDEHKQRAAGRQQSDPTRQAIRDAGEPLDAKGRTGGAFGKFRDPNQALAGSMQDKDSETLPSTRRAPKRR
jgi:hypothetical protein